MILVYSISHLVLLFLSTILYILSFHLEVLFFLLLLSLMLNSLMLRHLRCIYISLFLRVVQIMVLDIPYKFLAKCTTHLCVCVFGNTLSNEPLNPAIPPLDIYNIFSTPRYLKFSNTPLQKLYDSLLFIHIPSISLYPCISTTIIT